MKPTPKAIANLLNDQRVDSFSDEREQDCGYWIYLKPGWINIEDEIHMIHEDSVKSVMAKLANVVECDCGQCHSER
jgi:hypothetical protein